MTANVHRFPLSRIVRLHPRGGILADGRPCRLLQVGCGRVKVEYLDERGHVTTDWFCADMVLLREYERLTAGDDRTPSDSPGAA